RDFLTVHAPDTTGREMLSESAHNLNMTMLIRMQSNGLPVNVDVTSPEAAAAYERGRAVYFKRVGQRNHACADCHETDRGAGRFAGARFLSVAKEGLTKHFPLWFMAYRGVWDMRPLASSSGGELLSSLKAPRLASKSSCTAKRSTCSAASRWPFVGATR